MTNDTLMLRVQTLKLFGLLAHWEAVRESAWLPELLEWEEEERSKRGLDRRLAGSHLKNFKPVCEFDWSWPTKCDRETITELMQLAFIKEAANVVFCGPNGVGKTMLAKNIAHQAVLRGHTALFVTAGKMLNDLLSQQSDHLLRRQIRRYLSPQLLVIDEVGYLSYSNRHADLLFEIVSGRYEEKSTIITTNIPFNEWNKLFPSAACVVSLIDRLVHNAEIINIEGASFRLEEAKQRSDTRRAARSKKKASSAPLQAKNSTREKK
jgi:DNA replication protein DnaC